MDFVSTFQIWRAVLTKPGEKIFQQERPNANLTTALIWITIAAVIAAVFGAATALVNGFTGRAAQITPSLYTLPLDPQIREVLLQFANGSPRVVVAVAGTVFCLNLIIILVGFLIGSGSWFLIAKLFGGDGNFEQQTYLLATFIAPMIIVSPVVSVVPFVGSGLAVLLLIYQLVLLYFALKVSHNFTSGWTLGIMFGPWALAILGLCCLAILYSW